jgi:hypothetical protein
MSCQSVTVHVSGIDEHAHHKRVTSMSQLCKGVIYATSKGQIHLMKIPITSTYSGNITFERMV